MDIIEIIENNPTPWTVAKFAMAMGVSADHIYDLIKAGKLPAFYLGSKILLNPARTADWLRKQNKLSDFSSFPAPRKGPVSELASAPARRAEA